MKQIRRSVFETNSSSSHSISITGNDNYCKYHGDIIYGEFGEFGWGIETLYSIDEKLSYVLTMMQYKIPQCSSLDNVKESIYYKWLSEMIKDYTGAILDVIACDDYYEMGYIDHESTDLLDDYWSNDEFQFKTNMKEIIFNCKYNIIIDNDNH